MARFPSSLRAAALLLPVASCASMSLVRSYAGSTFLDGFQFRDAAYFQSIGQGNDPTDGFVNYLSASDAASQGLTKVLSTDQVYIGVDNTTVLSSTSTTGRGSLRLESYETFTTGNLVIVDMAHMPGGACGVWQALWSYNFDEDPIGEIDMIEGGGNSGLQAENVVSLHTGCDSCSFTDIGGTDSREQCDLGGTGTNCDGGDDVNWSGCGSTGSSQSFGDAFNAAGGGVYALYVESDRLRVWSWPRASIPADITAGSPNPDGWGTASSDFQTVNGGCDVSEFFKDQTLIINTDFCGSTYSDSEWAASATCSGAAASCEAYVAEFPGAYDEAYWLFNSIDVYGPGTGGDDDDGSGSGGDTVSTSGSCGAGTTCLGSEFGDCCSQYGYCGSTTAYCGTGCQDAYGSCS